MNYYLKIVLACIIATQGAFVRAYESEPLPPPPPPKIPTLPNIPAAPPSVCQNCIPVGALKGEVFSINGVKWELDHLLSSGDWFGIPRYDEPTLNIPEIYRGESVDATFGRGAFNVPNFESVRWMNAKYGPFDTRLASRDRFGTAYFTGSQQAEKRGKVFEGTTEEFLNLLKSFKQNLSDSTEFKNSFICQEVDCASELQTFTSMLINGNVVADSTSPNEFMQDFYNHLPDTSSYAADQAGLAGRYIDTMPYLSIKKGEFDSLRTRLNQYPVSGPQQWDAKVAAFNTIRLADNAYLNNLTEIGDLLFNVAKGLVDLATDIVPFTSIPKDGYRLLVGKDPTTGEPLSSFERALAGAFMAGAFLTVGASNTLKLETKVVQAIAKATEGEVKLAEKLTQVIAKSPLKVEVLIKGTSGEFTIIGRDMARVTEVGAALEKEGIKVNTLNGFSEATETEWLYLRNLYIKKPGDLIPYEEVMKSKRLIDNKEWLESAIKNGHTVIDLGNPMARDVSAFYDMEKSVILNYFKRSQKW